MNFYFLINCSTSLYNRPKKYVDEYNLKHVTTADILVEAFSRKLITEEQGNEIWSEMLKKRRKIGGNSFTEYLQRVEK